MTSYVGVDVGKKTLYLYLPVVEQSFEFSNNQQGFHKLLKGINKYYKSLLDTIIVFEPIGGYERNLREFLKFNKISFATVHPNKVRSYAKAKGWLAKTDYIDAKLLSDYATVFSLPIKQSYDSKTCENLHSLMQRREQLILLKNQETNRLETRFNQLITESINDHIAHLDKQLKQIQIAIEEVCKSDIEIQNKVSRLTSIPGVGITVATITICGAPELGNIEFKELTALIGLAPYARESGNYKGRRSIFAGRGNLRKVLYMSAVASLRYNQKLKTFYDRLIANHKPPKVALVAVMRKLLGFMHAIIKNNSFWNQNYANN